MIFEIRADREVASKGPEGSGTRRRTVKLPDGPKTLVIGAQPIYLEADALPPEIDGDEHFLVKTLDDGAPDGATVISLKAERVQEEIAAEIAETAVVLAEQLKPKRRR